MLTMPVFQKMLREIRQTTSVPAAEHGTCFANTHFGLNSDHERGAHGGRSMKEETSFQFRSSADTASNEPEKFFGGLFSKSAAAGQVMSR